MQCLASLFYSSKTEATQALTCLSVQLSDGKNVTHPNSSCCCCCFFVQLQSMTAVYSAELIAGVKRVGESQQLLSLQ